MASFGEYMSYKTLLDVDTSELSQIELPLYSDIYYTFTTILEQKTFNIEIQFVSFSESWNISILDEDQEPVLMNQALVPSYPIDLPYAAGVEGFLFLEPIAENANGKWDDLKWDLSTNYTLNFITKTSLL